jgi:cytochrome c oxidase subunit 2
VTSGVASRPGPPCTRHAGIALALFALASACSGTQTTFNPAGPQARQIANHWWFFLAVCTGVYVLTLVALAWASLRRRSHALASEDTSPQGITRAVGAALVASVLILFVLLVSSVLTGRATSGPFGASPVTIAVTGHQWWWDVRYDEPTPSDRVHTANEIHIPIGEPVLIRLTSTDVIHSFWVPNLQGKKDAIPGHVNELWLTADRAGVYRGQCAEFCGHQHAKMALLVIVEPRSAFDAWMAQQRKPAPEPSTSEAVRGRQVFLSTQCVMCHTIRGTTAAGVFGPELTHLASRRMLAAATLPNARGSLAGWIIDPHSIKPGVRMPPNLVQASDLQALLTYLETLQ